MALFEALSGFDISTFDLNYYVRNYDRENLKDNVNSTWEDIYHIYSTNDTAFSYYGAGLGYDENDDPTGIVQAISEWILDPDGGASTQLYRAAGLSVPFADFYQASRTETTGDDLAVLRSAFSGRDTFELSADRDHMRGFGGNDRMFGYGGADILRGDGGRDRLFGGADNDVLKGGNGGDFLRGGPGRDREYGGKGEDVFIFKTGDDMSIIKDFDARGAVHDVIDLSGLASVKHWSDLKNNHMTRVGTDVEIDGGGGDVIRIKDVTLGSLDKGDFLF